MLPAQRLNLLENQVNLRKNNEIWLFYVNVKIFGRKLPNITILFITKNYSIFMSN